MADDYYRFVERAHILRGENTGKVYRLGDRVQVQVVRVDMERRQVDLGLVEILDAVRESEREPRAAPQQGAAERSESQPGGRGAKAAARQASSAAGQEANAPAASERLSGVRGTSSSAPPATSITARARSSARSPAPIPTA